MGTALEREAAGTPEVFWLGVFRAICIVFLFSGNVSSEYCGLVAGWWRAGGGLVAAGLRLVAVSLPATCAHYIWGLHP